MAYHNGEDDRRIRKGRVTFNWRKPCPSLLLLLFLALSLSLFVSRNAEATRSSRLPTGGIHSSPKVPKEPAAGKRWSTQGIDSVGKKLSQAPKAFLAFLRTLKSNRERSRAIKSAWDDLNEKGWSSLRTLELLEEKKGQFSQSKGKYELREWKEAARRAETAVQEYENAANTFRSLTEPLPSKKREAVADMAGILNNIGEWRARIEKHNSEILKSSEEEVARNWNDLSEKEHAATVALRNAEEKYVRQDAEQMSLEELEVWKRALDGVRKALKDYEEAANALKGLGDLLPSQKKAVVEDNAFMAIENIKIWRAKIEADHWQASRFIAVLRWKPYTEARTAVDDAVNFAVEKAEQALTTTKSPEKLTEWSEAYKKAMDALKAYERAGQKLNDELAPEMAPPSMAEVKSNVEVAFGRLNGLQLQIEL